jgi:hypothetical protein
MDMHVGDVQRRKPSSSTPRLSLDLAWKDLRSCADQGANCAQATSDGRGKLQVLPNILTTCVIFVEMTSWDSRLPWRRHRPAQTVSVTQTELLYLLFLAMLGSPTHPINWPILRKARQCDRVFLSTPYSSPRCVEYRASYPRHWKCTPGG